MMFSMKAYAVLTETLGTDEKTPSQETDPFQDTGSLGRTREVEPQKVPHPMGQNMG